jgi:hypothetical protein
LGMTIIDSYYNSVRPRAIIELPLGREARQSFE